MAQGWCSLDAHLYSIQLGSCPPHTHMHTATRPRALLLCGNRYPSDARKQEHKQTLTFRNDCACCSTWESTYGCYAAVAYNVRPIVGTASRKIHDAMHTCIEQAQGYVAEATSQGTIAYFGCAQRMLLPPQLLWGIVSSKPFLVMVMHYRFP